MRRFNAWIYRGVLVAALLVPAFLMAYKMAYLDYSFESIVPVRSFRVDLSMQVDGRGEDVSVSTYLPKTDARQMVNEEENSSGSLTLTIKDDGQNRLATWKGSALEGLHTIVYSYSIEAKGIRYDLPEGIPIPKPPLSLEPLLKDEPGLDIDDPLIGKTLKEIFPHGVPSARESLTHIHRFVQDKLENRTFSGYTEAVTALKLGEGSCNGKSRLFVAFARKIGFPARLVGGFILEPGSKRTSHQWAEVYLNGYWVPFDTLNDHFAELPENYLTLYYGDLPLFKHTADINFHYFFKTTRRLVPNSRELVTVQASPLNFMNMYAVFQKVGISQNLLKIILMLPLGALVTAVLRNVVGLETFGTFLPVLIAAAARETGYWWGMAGFVIILAFGSGLRRILEYLQLLHTPKMTIMLTAVVALLLGVASAAVSFNLIDLAHVTLFPIAILAITSERFALVEMEQGLRKALKLLAVTLVAVGACFAAMSMLVLQNLFLVFPEALLYIVALALWLGRWSGIRVLEFLRFRLLWGRGAS